MIKTIIKAFENNELTYALSETHDDQRELEDAKESIIDLFSSRYLDLPISNRYELITTNSTNFLNCHIRLFTFSFTEEQEDPANDPEYLKAKLQDLQALADSRHKKIAELKERNDNQTRYNKSLQLKLEDSQTEAVNLKRKQYDLQKMNDNQAQTIAELEEEIAQLKKCSPTKNNDLNQGILHLARQGVLMIAEQQGMPDDLLQHCDRACHHIERAQENL